MEKKRKIYFSSNHTVSSLFPPEPTLSRLLLIKKSQLKDIETIMILSMCDFTVFLSCFPTISTQVHAVVSSDVIARLRCPCSPTAQSSSLQENQGIQHLFYMYASINTRELFVPSNPYV